MAVIKIDRFGGIAPSVEPRNLTPDGAQTAHNLELRYGDFRPVRSPGASVATVSAGTKTIFRTPSGVWLSSLSDTNYVNGQINDAASERVYLTGRSAYPEAWQSGAYRRLGVPAPLLAPTLAAGVVDEYSTEDDGLYRALAVDGITAAAIAARSASTMGAGIPSNGGTLGGVWLAHGDAPNLPTSTAFDVAYAVPATGTAASPVITAASDQYLLDPTLGGRFITYSATTWWAVGALWRATGYDISVPTLATAVKALRKPPENTLQLIPDADADKLAQSVADWYLATKDPTLSRVAEINRLQAELVSQVLKTDTSAARASALKSAASSLSAAILALNQYQASISANLKELIAGELRVYQNLLPAAVTRLLETRAYIFTYVSEWGEESAPSPASELIEIDQNDTVLVTRSASVVAPPYGPLTHWRLYRSSTTEIGAAYQLVDEIAIGTLTYNDAKLQEELQEVCPSLTWVEPPAIMLGLVGLPNGIMAGFFGKTLCFAEPFHPYAWPVEYQLTVEHNIVALGVFGQTLVALTEGNPYYVSGADSASMSAQKLESTQACVSKRSVASAEGAVIYASPDGICAAGPAGVELLTLGAYDKFDWQALGVTSSFAAFSEGVYYIFTGA